MIVDIVDKLIDRFVQLINHRKEQNQDLYTSFVEPAIGAFEAVHQNYMESFKAYRKILKSSTKPLNMNHPLLDKIKEDSLFSSEIRSKVVVLKDADGDPVVGPFAKDVATYVLGQEIYNTVILDGFRPPPNSFRMQMIVGLKKIFEDSGPAALKKKKALETIDRLIEERQADYHGVMRAYAKLRAQLLSPDVKLNK